MLKQFLLSTVIISSLLIGKSIAQDYPEWSKKPETISDSSYFKPLELYVDASDIERHIYRVRQVIPVKSGEFFLYYPQWIPGNHSPTGPINKIAGLTIKGNNQPIAWERDPLSMYRFRMVIPDGVDVIQVEFHYLSPTSSDQGRIAITPNLLSVQWNMVLLYPAGYQAKNISIIPALKLPNDWKFGTALEGQKGGNSNIPDWIQFSNTNVADLIDSPVYAGRYFQKFTLDQSSDDPPVYLNVVADAPHLLNINSSVLESHRNLIKQADYIFGPRPYTHYNFLLAASDQFSGIGLEHHQSSENGQPANYLLGTAPFIDNDLLPHEYVHTWNGKYRRPNTTHAPHFNTPVNNQLLWLYEGQTQYWAMVLSARSGLWNMEQAKDMWAVTAANSEYRKGREWRNLQDTVYQGIIDFNDAPQAWENWQRGYDFYPEGALLWLEADAIIRNQSNKKRSLDDFANAFFKFVEGRESVSLFTQEDIVAALQKVQPYNWQEWLKQQLHSNQYNPLLGLAGSGWGLVYDENANSAITAAENSGNYDDFSYSLGFKIDRKSHNITEILWESPAYQVGLTKDIQMIAINGFEYTPERLKQAVTANKNGSAKINILVKQDNFYREISIPYSGGLRYPHLQRVENIANSWEKIMQARSR